MCIHRTLKESIRPENKHLAVLKTIKLSMFTLIISRAGPLCWRSFNYEPVSACSLCFCRRTHGKYGGAHACYLVLDIFMVVYLNILFQFWCEVFMPLSNQCPQKQTRLFVQIIRFITSPVTACACMPLWNLKPDPACVLAWQIWAFDNLCAGGHTKET